MNWDHHDAIYSTSHTNIPNGGAGSGRFGIGTWPMMGSLDQAYSALITDLDQRGLLADTLVCLVTEFGRTPKVNDRQGRDHWTQSRVDRSLVQPTGMAGSSRAAMPTQSKTMLPAFLQRLG
jgi:hypothetical protein